ncbi:hypothetical protein BASA81_003821 [Batrachochytrium salamandrivorans]|nr:hypothetical protein BASA81_003821 [Batrachochytrium salamandrivorans]
MLESMVKPGMVSQDKAIPLTLLRSCQGVAFIRLYKAGMFFLGGNLGGGCVICKIEDPSAPLGYRWSAPVAVQCGGLGGGFVFGGEQIDSVIILNTSSAIRAFTGKGQITFGGNVSLAVGPVGKDIGAQVGVSDNKELVAAYSYSQARGAYIGGTLEGAFLVIRDEENKRFYGNLNATAENLIKGTVSAPPSAQALANELNLIMTKQGVYSKIQTSSSRDMNLAQSGRELIKQGMSGNNLVTPALPEDWESALSPDGKVYYYNVKTNQTSWDRPVATPQPPPPVIPQAPPAPAAVAQKPVVPANRPVVPASRPAAAKPIAVPTKLAMYDYTANQADELSFKQNDCVEILGQVDSNWAQGRLHGKTGLVPLTYLQ